MHPLAASDTDIEWPIGLGLAILAGIVLLARRGGTTTRTRVRRTTMLYGVYILVFACRHLASAMGGSPARGALDAIGALLPSLIVVNLAALFFFNGLLALFKLSAADILHDLTVGGGYAVAFGWFLHNAGVDVSSLVTTSAVVTAVLGLSLQPTLGNLVGGLALQLDDSIDAGDWIELDGRVQGRVKEIRWRHTVLETRDWDTLIVPNSALLSQTIKVLGRREGAPSQHRMWVYFNVDFRFSPVDVVRSANEALQSAPIPNVASEPKPHCICYDLARDHKDSFAHYAVRYFLTDLAVDDPTSSRVRERVYAGLQRAQIPLALPGATVFLSQDDPEHARRKVERDTSQRCSALGSVVLFAGLSDDEKRHLAEKARLVPFTAGEVMTRQGAPGHWLYVLTRGDAEVRVAQPDVPEHKVAELHAPTFFGEMALMTGQPREATVVAVTDAECLRVDKDDFREILAKRPELAHEISAVLAQRRLELLAARDHLDKDARKGELASEHSRILGLVRAFFGLDSAS